MIASFKRRLTVCAALSLIALPALAQKKYDPGASDTEIKIGNIAPYSGPVSSYSISARVINAYFKMLNDKGGINGRKLVFVSYDDQFAPPKTIEAARKLVEQDEVLLITGNMGSAANLAIQRYMNIKKVPHLFIAVGGEKFNMPKQFPWTMGFNPSYQAEAHLYAREILRTKPDAKIAVLYQNDEMGKDMIKGFHDGLGDKAKSMIVAEQSYEVSDPTVDSQMVQLKASGANVFVNMSLSRAAAQAIRKAADLGWKPDQQYLVYNAANVKTTFEPAGLDKSVGIISSAFFKDPQQSRWDNDPAMKEYREFMKKYAPNEDPNNSTASYGYTSAQAIEWVLRKAGDNLTRENVMKQATSFQNVTLPMMLPGVVLNNSANDYYPISTLQLVRFNGKELEPIGEPAKIK